MINNNLQRLADSLGYFASGVSALTKKQEIEKEKADKAEAEAGLAKLEEWSAGLTDTQQLEAIYAGKAPYYSNPIIRKVVHQGAGRIEAAKLADELEAEIAQGKVAGWGTTEFDAEAL